jgi:protein involved in sex pheromone biosynthesis
MKKIFGLAVVSMALFLTSCATLVNGTKQTVSLNSEPAGASVVIVNKKGLETSIGNTPMVVEIPRKTKFIKFNAEGYQTETFNARENADVHWLYWLDLVSCFYGNIIPVVVDLSTGSYIMLQENVKVELKKI